MSYLAKKGFEMNKEDFDPSTLHAMSGDSDEEMVIMVIDKVVDALEAQLGRVPTVKESLEYFRQLRNFYDTQVEPLGLRPIKDLPTIPPYQTL